MRRGGSLPTVAACVLIAAAWFPVTGPVMAADINWSVGTGLEYSDNPARVNENTHPDLTRIAQGTLGIAEVGSRLSARLSTQYKYSDFRENTFEDRGRAQAFGSLDWQIIPEELKWVAHDTYQQVPDSTRAVATPETEQSVNGFVTGPDLLLSLGGADFARLAVRYGDFEFSKTNEDNRRIAASAGLGRRIDPTTEVSFNVAGQHVDYTQENATQEDYDQTSAFGRYDREIPGGRATLDLGRVAVARDRLPNVTGTLAQVTVLWRIKPETETGLSYTQGTTDIGEVLIGPRNDPLTVDPRDITLTGDIGKERRMQAFGKRNAGALALGGSIYTAEQRYGSVDLDRDVTGGTLRADYSVTYGRTLFASFSSQTSDYRALDVRDRDIAGSLGIRESVGRSTELELTFLRERQRSDTPTLRFIENVVMLTLTYTGREPRRTQEGF